MVQTSSDFNELNFVYVNIIEKLRPIIEKYLLIIMNI